MHGSWRTYRCVKQARELTRCGFCERYLATHATTRPPPLLSPSAPALNSIWNSCRYFHTPGKWPGDASLTHCGPDRHCKMLNASRGEGGYEGGNGGRGPMGAMGGRGGARKGDRNEYMRTQGWGEGGGGDANKFITRTRKAVAPAPRDRSFHRDSGRPVRQIDSSCFSGKARRGIPNALA